MGPIRVDTEEIHVLSEQEIFGSPLTIYGTAEKPLFLVSEVAACIGRGNASYLTQNVRESDSTVRIIYNGSRVTYRKFVTKEGLRTAMRYVGTPLAEQFMVQVEEILKGMREGSTAVPEKESPMEGNTKKIFPYICSYNVEGKILRAYGSRENPLILLWSIIRAAGLTKRCVPGYALALPEGMSFKAKIHVNDSIATPISWLVTAEGANLVLDRLAERYDVDSIRLGLRLMLESIAEKRGNVVPMEKKLKPLPKPSPHIEAPVPMKKEAGPPEWDRKAWMQELTEMVDALKGVSYMIVRSKSEKERKPFETAVQELGADIFAQ
ncbi:MAG: hypothetical protein IKH16_09750, partial [Selenomonadaceae bacterium]|nr:hypothetical protein [Selenomonadaceae bacterium]